jgi:hypothetical protein
MSTFHDLSRRVGDLAAPTVDVDELVALGEQRLRRRRVTGAAAATAAVAVLAVAGALANAHRVQTSGPIDLPHHPRQTERHVPTAPVRREIVYAGGLGDPTIHYGDRVLRVQTGYVHLDVTDAGFVYTTPGTLQEGDRAVWFSDGTDPEQIGTHCGLNLPRTPNDVVSGSSGSLVVWFDCTDPGKPTLVAHDTSTGRDLVDHPIALCATRPSQCDIDAIIGEHVYLTRVWFRHGDGGLVRRGYVLDLGTGRLSAVTPRYGSVGNNHLSDAYLAELRSSPRGLVVGDTWETGTITNGIGQTFDVVGSRLVPKMNVQSEQFLAKAAFDTATGQALRLHVPEGYHRADSFTLTQWLDDDTIALAVAGQGLYSGDILACDLSDGGCTFAVEGQGSETGVGAPLFPQMQLPA